MDSRVCLKAKSVKVALQSSEFAHACRPWCDICTSNTVPLLLLIAYELNLLSQFIVAKMCKRPTSSSGDILFLMIIFSCPQHEYTAKFSPDLHLYGSGFGNSLQCKNKATCNRYKNSQCYHELLNLGLAIGNVMSGFSTGKWLQKHASRSFPNMIPSPHIDPNDIRSVLDSIN